MCTCCWCFLDISEPLFHSKAPAGDAPPFSSLPAHSEEKGILGAARTPHAHTGMDPSGGQCTQPQPAFWPNTCYPPMEVPATNKGDSFPATGGTQESDDPSENWGLETLVCPFHTSKQFSYPKQGNKTVELLFSDLHLFY